jgi:hypothetical protein
MGCSKRWSCARKGANEGEAQTQRRWQGRNRSSPEKEVGAEKGSEIRATQAMRWRHNTVALPQHLSFSMTVSSGIAIGQPSRITVPINHDCSTPFRLIQRGMQDTDIDGPETPWS